MVSMLPPASEAKSTWQKYKGYAIKHFINSEFVVKATHYHNGSGLHVVNHILLDENGRLLAWDERGSNDNVDVLALVVEQLHLSFKELLRHLFCVATFGRTVLFNIHFQKLGTHRLDLFLDIRSDVKALKCMTIDIKIKIQMAGKYFIVARQFAKNPNTV